MDFEICNFVDLFMPKHTLYTLTKIQKVKKHNRTPLKLTFRQLSLEYQYNYRMAKYSSRLKHFGQLDCIVPKDLKDLLVKSGQVRSSQVTFIYIALLTIQIVSKQLHNIKIGK